MPLIEDIPESLRPALGSTADGKPDAVMVTMADLLPDATFGLEWLVVTRDRLRVFALPPRNASAPPAPRLDIALADITAATADSLIGGGALLVTVNAQSIEVLRYTNARQRSFGRVIKYLADLAQYNADTKAAKPELTEPRPDDSADDARRCAQCNLLLPEGTKVCPACLDKGQVLWRIMCYLKPYWRQTVVVWLLMGLSSLVSLIPPYLSRPLVDKVLVPASGTTSVSPAGAAAPGSATGHFSRADEMPDSGARATGQGGHSATGRYAGATEVLDTLARLRWLGLLVLGMLAAQLAGQVIGIIRGRMVVWLGTNLAHDLRTRLYQHLQLMSLRFYEKRPTGSLISRVMQDTDSLESVIIDGAQHLVVNILLLFGIGIVLLLMDWKMTLFILLPTPLVIFLSRLFWVRIMGVWHKYWFSRQQLSASLNDSLSGIRVVRAFAQEQQEISRFTTQSRVLFESALQAERSWISFFPILSFLISTGTLIAWYVGGWTIIHQPDRMSLGTLTAFIAYLGMFYGPIQFLSRITDYLARSLTAAQRVFEILDSEADVPEANDALRMSRIVGRVEFRNVTFGYDAHKPVLQNVSIDVQAGEMIGLVGHSGAGKSTTINLICRFYDVQSGQILIDGIDIRKMHQEDLRSQIGVVLQDTFLFNGTITDNIGYAKPGASLEEIISAAKAANAHDFIVQKPDGYDTKVGERGQALSGGERQRIAIARAILHNPRILILDEATSSVDTDTEKQIQEAIGRLIKNRTTFAIAHRLSTLRNANRLVVLKGGKIEEMGTHDELMAKKGEFRRLVEMQQDMSQIMAVGTTK